MPDSLRLSIEKAIEFLLQEQKINFRESLHELTFPRPGILGVPVFETHQTNLFQRAIALEALLCAKADGFTIPDSIIQQETDHIVNSKHPLVNGGWSYIPQLPDFPPDLDDLGAILQIAAKVKTESLHAICNDSIDLVFRCCMNPDGSIPTWTIDINDQSPAAISIRRCIDIIGGLGTHVEVIANFLEGLLEYDTGGVYTQHISKPIQYLCDAQSPDGSWPAKWYWGNLYSTYRVANVLFKTGIESARTKKIYPFLLSHQNNDGSWGNALDTSLGLLCLLNDPDKKYVPEMQQALKWLLDNQLDMGSWAPSPFIKMETRNGMLSYGSQTVSTAFVLKALLKADAYI
jgi:hypothetical protein